MVLGRGVNEGFVASDVTALLKYTNQFLYAVLGVQLGFVSPDKAMEVASAWLANKSTSILERLRANGSLSPEQAALVGWVGFFMALQTPTHA